MPDPSFYSRIGRLSSIIFILPSTMAAGWVLGYYLIDRYFSIYPWGSLSLTLVGAGAGLYEIVKILSMEKRGKGDPDK
jgi:F0F1-type ATP synthase assembly protein I